MSSPDVSVVICTYDRPAGLTETLRSVQGQANALGLAIEIVVLDNHPSQNGRAAAQGVAGPFPLRVVTELTRNMSTLRNRGFAEAAAPLAALIDDDEVAAPDWLDQLVGALGARGGAIAVGPRLARFETGAPPAYDPDARQFIRDLGLADGADIPLAWPSGKPRHGLGTGNSLFDLAACFGDGEPAMREAFGDAGGEDFELFMRLYRKGRRLVWAAKAVVTETVPAHRTQPAYRFVRARREAQHYVAIYLDGAARPRRTAAELWLKGLAQTVTGAAWSAATLEFGSHRRVGGRMMLANGLGKLRWIRPVGYIPEAKFRR